MLASNYFYLDLIQAFLRAVILFCYFYHLCCFIVYELNYVTPTVSDYLSVSGMHSFQKLALCIFVEPFWCSLFNSFQKLALYTIHFVWFNINYFIMQKYLIYLSWRTIISLSPNHHHLSTNPVTIIIHTHKILTIVLQKQRAS